MDVYLRSEDRRFGQLQVIYKVRIRYIQGTYKVEGSMCGCLLVDFNIVILGLHCLYTRYV